MNSKLDPPPEQPQILLQLRQKVSQLRSLQSGIKQNNRNLSNIIARSSDQLHILLRQKQVQERKSKSLVLLVSDLQRQIDDYYSLGQIEENDDELIGENKILRELLVKLAERAKENQKMLSLLRQSSASGPKAQEFLKKSKYLESQTELLTKLQSQISSFKNSNLECSRKWSDLQRQTNRLQKEQGFITIQAERIKTDLRQAYQQYLQSLNRSKASLVNFNQTQNQRIITQHLVEQVALLQQKRLGIQQQSKNLKHHQQILLEENTRIQMENRQLRSFFIGEGDQQHRLASKMRSRIQQLRDSLLEMQRLSGLPQLPVSNLADVIRGKLKSLEQTINYIQKKIKSEQQGKVSLEQSDIVTFFEGVLKNKDERLMITKQRQIASSLKLKDLKIKRQLLNNQINNLQQGLSYHHYENTSMKMNSLIGLSKNNQQQNNTYISSLGERRDRKLNDTNFVTTASKFIPN